MNYSQNFLVTVEEPAIMLDVLENFTEQLEERSFSIPDMFYMNCQSALFLLIRLEILDLTVKNLSVKRIVQSDKNNSLRC